MAIPFVLLTAAAQGVGAQAPASLNNLSSLEFFPAFVVRYVLEPQTKPGTFVFVSEALENIPKGYRSRETHVVLGADEFEEILSWRPLGKISSCIPELD